MKDWNRVAVVANVFYDHATFKSKTLEEFDRDMFVYNDLMSRLK